MQEYLTGAPEFRVPLERAIKKQSKVDRPTNREYKCGSLIVFYLPRTTEGIGCLEVLDTNIHIFLIV